MIQRVPFVLLAALFLTACGEAFFSEQYVCSVKGHSYRYRDGIRIEENIPKIVEFSLVTYRYRKTFRFNANGIFREHEAPNILLDPSLGSPIEPIYIYDQVSPDNNFRTVTSLVLNKTSGDVRIFHHRWIPPNEWRDSDMYMYAGNCRKK